MTNHQNSSNKIQHQYLFHWSFPHHLPVAEAETAAESGAMLRLLRTLVWNAPLSQLDSLHELGPHHRHDSGSRQRHRPLEVHHRARQQHRGQRNSSRVVSPLSYKGLIQSLVWLSFLSGKCVLVQWWAYWLHHCPGGANGKGWGCTQTRSLIYFCLWIKYLVGN